MEISPTHIVVHFKDATKAFLLCITHASEIQKRAYVESPDQLESHYASKPVLLIHGCTILSLLCRQLECVFYCSESSMHVARHPSLTISKVASIDDLVLRVEVFVHLGDLHILNRLSNISLGIGLYWSLE